MFYSNSSVLPLPEHTRVIFIQNLKLNNKKALNVIFFTETLIYKKTLLYIFLWLYTLVCNMHVLLTKIEWFKLN